jgi:hypothetical protein
LGSSPANQSSDDDTNAPFAQEGQCFLRRFERIDREAANLRLVVGKLFACEFERGRLAINLASTSISEIGHGGSNSIAREV